MNNTLKKQVNLLVVTCAMILFFVSVSICAQDNMQRPLTVEKGGKLQYHPNEKGDVVPDFSYAGYKASEVEIPLVKARIFVPSQKDDATNAIQKAINYISSQPVDKNGFRGAVLLDTGLFRCKGRLLIEASGVVLRGRSIAGVNTTIVADGKDRQTLIRIMGEVDLKIATPINITNDYVPVNARELMVEKTENLQVGDQIIVNRPSSIKWIHELGMREMGGEETGWIGWKPGTRDIQWDRRIVAIDDNVIMLDAPITMALDKQWGTSTISKYQWKGRINNVGVENINLVSKYDKRNPKDEDHCWTAISVENAQNIWIRQMNFRHFAGSAVALFETAGKVTVQDCISKEPVSEIGGQRRYTYYSIGQQTLFQRCYSEYGYHDFAVGFCAAGPNAFVQCEAYLPFEFSGTIDSWATAVLFDIVNVDGHAISFKNQEINNQGSGWTAANSMLWQCTAARIDNYAPPTAMNWAYGAWSQFFGNGIWVDQNNHVNPRSLFYAQLSQRLNQKEAMYADQIMPYSGHSTSSPTAEQAKQYSKMAFMPKQSLEDWIRSASIRDPLKTSCEGLKSIHQVRLKATKEKHTKALIAVDKGKLVLNGKLLNGMRFNVPWWRGIARPYGTLKTGPAVTRFVPGRNGHGYTDNLNEVIDWMDQNNMIGLEHNYGLWYDRRRDDHERVRRMNGQVWAPFYEQPFARSGKERAWDGLSKYDLTTYNYFYWSRLKQFADLADENGKLLLHHNYFQHNILEAGAHWADSPWRPANNINETGFPEPVPYAGDKRIYMAEQFYDETNAVRRPLHKAFIKQCMNNFADNSNVLQLISEEYTGPFHFTKFWLETIDEWRSETGKDQLIGLSATKDVQDSVLMDEKLASLVDVIDIRYWAYREDGTLYAPLSAQQLAPRQHARKVKPGKRSFNSVYRSVYEYTSKYPDKAVIYSYGRYNVYAWAVFMAGGSLAVLPGNLPELFLQDAAKMFPEDPGKTPDKTCMLKGENGMIVYCSNKDRISLDLTREKGKYLLQFIDPHSGSLLDKKLNVKGQNVVSIDLPQQEINVIWIRKK